jgi:tRNA nucleotidyltransferase (CCA-adding enzyme)
MPTAVREFVRSLGLDAYVVGGAVRDELLGIEHRDEDFLVPGVDQPRLRALLAASGRVDDLEVNGRLVGVRLHPREQRIRDLAPAGIEFSPPRTERSTGPGHRDFEVVADGSVSIEEDMRRRDLTVNAMARRLETGTLVDPFGGLAALGRRELKTVTRDSFREDPLRLLRALRLVSQLGFDLAGETLVQMRQHAAAIEHVAPERIGGGIAVDGHGELSRLLLGREPARALRLARETGVLGHVIPELRPAIGFGTPSDRQPATVDEHVFQTTQETASRGAPLVVRLAALLHDVAKPFPGRGGSHAVAGAAIAKAVLERLRYPVRLQRRVAYLVAAHDFRPGDVVGEAAARRFLASHGEAAAFDLLALKEADLAAKRATPEEYDALRTLRGLLEQARASPYRLSDLAVDGSDLIELGFPEGPELGRTLQNLLDVVIDDPRANTRDGLLARAREALG